MQQVRLSRGLFALVDDCDFPKINKHKWCVCGKDNNWYAMTIINRKTVLMHRFILEIKEKLVYVDHINHNSLDNRRENLRLCGNSENQHNSKKHRDNTSGYKGVYWNKSAKKWIAYINIKKKGKHIGAFEDKIEAAKAYDKYAISIFGEFANPNFKQI